MTNKEKVPRRNVLGRINRALKKTGGGTIVFKRTELAGEGHYTRIDAKNNPTGEKVNLAKLAKELDVLKPWETTE